MALARVSLIDEGKLAERRNRLLDNSFSCICLRPESNVILDELVLPDEPITNYLTEYSGITPEMMANTTTSLRRAQKHVRKFVDHNVILVGHGLHNDLKALKLTHPYCIDTSIIYHHTRGPPFRPGLKWLSSRYLKRDIQNTDPNHGGRIGHDPREDATATLDLVKLKIKRGATFGLLHDDKELIFHRIKRFRPPRHGAIVESAEQPNKLLSAALGKDYMNCPSDNATSQKTIEALADKDFILCKWAVLETVNNDKAQTASDNGIPTVVAAHGSSISNEKAHAIESLIKFNKQFKTLYDQLPTGTAVVVMGGLGDLRNVQK
jgi:RNA exonuclease 1